MNRDEIKAIRKRLKINTAEFGRILGVTQSAVEKWESTGNLPCDSNQKLMSLMFRKGIFVECKGVEKSCDTLEQAAEYVEVYNELGLESRIIIKGE